MKNSVECIGLADKAVVGERMHKNLHILYSFPDLSRFSNFLLTFIDDRLLSDMNQSNF